jgi:diacylglycerol kinase
MSKEELPGPRTWASKFRDAGRGIGFAVRAEKSFIVHAFATICVIAAAAALRVSPNDWAILLVCVGCVVTAECFNSAVESLARTITSEKNPEIGQALDMAAGAVLLISIGSACAGLAIFTPHVLRVVTL